MNKQIMYYLEIKATELLNIYYDKSFNHLWKYEQMSMLIAVIETLGRIMKESGDRNAREYHTFKQKYGANMEIARTWCDIFYRKNYDNIEEV